MEQETCSHSEKGGQAMPPEAEQKGAESGHQGQMNMGHPGGYPSQPPYPGMQHPGHPPYADMQQSSHKCSGSSHPGQMNTGHPGGYPSQPPYPGMQHPGMNTGYPSDHSGQPPYADMRGGHPKQGQSHCSCGSHQQYGTAHVSHQQYGPGHVSEMMGRFMTGGITADDMNAVSSFFGIDCQSTRFWTGIALGAVGALILTKAFKS